MIDELLSLARAGDGGESIHVERVEARALVREAAALCETLATAKGLGLGFDLPDDAIKFDTDHGKARQILVNLVGNAIKYTEQGQIRLGVQAEAGRVVFRVHHSGIGVAVEHQERIFERFWQVSDGLARSTAGLGLGLAAAREFSRLLGGDVEVRSEQGDGSVFTLWLPLRRDVGGRGNAPVR